MANSRLNRESVRLPNRGENNQPPVNLTVNAGAGGNNNFKTSLLVFLLGSILLAVPGFLYSNAVPIAVGWLRHMVGAEVELPEEKRRRLEEESARKTPIRDAIAVSEAQDRERREAQEAAAEARRKDAEAQANLIKEQRLLAEAEAAKKKAEHDARVHAQRQADRAGAEAEAEQKRAWDAAHAANSQCPACRFPMRINDSGTRKQLMCPKCKATFLGMVARRLGAPSTSMQGRR